MQWIEFQKKCIPIIRNHYELNSNTVVDNGYTVIGRLIHELRRNVNEFDDNNLYVRSLQALMIQNGYLLLKKDEKLNDIKYSVQFIIDSNDDIIEPFNNKQFILLNTKCIKYCILMNDIYLQRDIKITENENILIFKPNSAYVINNYKVIQRT